MKYYKCKRCGTIFTEEFPTRCCVWRRIVEITETEWFKELERVAKPEYFQEALAVQKGCVWEWSQ